MTFRPTSHIYQDKAQAAIWFEHVLNGVSSLLFSLVICDLETVTNVELRNAKCQVQLRILGIFCSLCKGSLNRTAVAKLEHFQGLFKVILWVSLASHLAGHLTSHLVGHLAGHLTSHLAGHIAGKFSCHIASH